VHPVRRIFDAFAFELHDEIRLSIQRLPQLEKAP
jgi:hypothetical protein